jgi:hypothetical protein
MHKPLVAYFIARQLKSEQRLQWPQPGQPAIR